MFTVAAMPTPPPQTSAFRSFCVYHLPAILFAAAIIAVSLIPELQTPKLRTLALDKAAHFLEYAVFAFLVHRSMSRFCIGANTMRPFVLSLILLALFAVVSEVLQHFVPGRHLDLRDIAADLIGGLLVLLFLEVRSRARRRRQEPGKPV